MFTSTLFVSLLSASAALALPPPPPAPVNSYIDRASSKPVTNVKLPTSTLPPPASNLNLKFIVLGYGTQNYSCATTPNDATATPATAGAVADLYDPSNLLGSTKGNVQTLIEDSIPPLVLSLGQTFGVKPDQFPGPVNMRKVGHHFFAAGAVPTFELHGLAPDAQIGLKKNANVPAPDGAFDGMKDEGAVDWLQLVDNVPGYTSPNLKGGEVYRVVTAGGKAPATCKGVSAGIQVPYAAFYFVYGPKP
jgi:hypothetical protein